MKFLAMLRDSLRETLDAKLFYVMIVLSILVVLLAGSVTYRTVTMKEYLEANTGLASFVMRGNPDLRKIEFKIGIENFSRKDERKEPWLGDYEYDQTIRLALQEGANDEDKRRFEQFRRIMRPLLTPALMEKQLQQQYPEVEVEEIKSEAAPEPNVVDVRLRINTKGTNFKSKQEWFHQPSMFFGLVDLPVSVLKMSDIITFIVNWVVGTFGAAFTMLVSIVLTASFLPNMMAKGSVDMLITKPMTRPTLFLYKWIGGLLFMFLNTSVIMVGLFLVLGIQAGVWLTSLLWLIPLYTLLFAILYSISALFAVLTRNAIVCILVTCLAWGALFAVGWAHFAFVENRREGREQEAPETVRTHWGFITFDVLYQLTPRYKEIDWLGNKLLEQEFLRPRNTPDDEKLRAKQEEVYREQLEKLDKRFGNYTWSRALPVTLLFIAVMLGLACWRFSVRDY